MSGISGIRAKSRKDAENVDRISDLPEGILSHILSLVPIKEAVQTCILSKSWEFKWMSIYDVNILYVDKFKQWSDNASFVRFVVMILLHLHNLRSFHLITTLCGEKELWYAPTWISAVLGRNIESLEFRMYLEHGEILTLTENPMLPRSILNCSALKKLVVVLPCTFKVPIRDCFANLTILYLVKVRIVNTGTLVFNCPVLKKFTVEDCLWLKVKAVEIYAPLLTKFTSITPFEYRFYEQVFNYQITIFGAKIAKFDVFDGYPENIVLKDSTVEYAVIKCQFDDCDLSSEECNLRVRKLLRDMYSLKHLWLYNLPWDGPLIGLPLPQFEKLENLEIGFSRVEPLLELLHATPFLKFLNMEMADYQNEEIELVPSCIISHLEEVVFDYSYLVESECMESEFFLEKFFLKYALQLKKVSISNCEDDNMVKKLSAFPKASQQLTFACI